MSKHTQAGTPGKAAASRPDTGEVERVAKVLGEYRFPMVGWHADTNTYAVYFFARPEGGGILHETHGYATVGLASADIYRLVALAVLSAASATDVSASPVPATSAAPIPGVSVPAVAVPDVPA